MYTFRFIVKLQLINLAIGRQRPLVKLQRDSTNLTFIDADWPIYISLPLWLSSRFTEATAT